MSHGKKSRSRKRPRSPMPSISAANEPASPRRSAALKFDLYLALISLLFPLGWSMSGFQPDITLACFCWVSSLALLLHAFWIYEKSARLRLSVKLVVMVAVLAIVAVVGWQPVLGEYRREHAPPTFAFVVPGVVLY